MGWVRKVGILLAWVLLIVSTAVVTAAVKQRSEDGPNRVFSGGSLVSGELHQGSEPDWSFTKLQSLDKISLQGQLLFHFDLAFVFDTAATFKRVDPLEWTLELEGLSDVSEKLYTSKVV